MAVLSITRAMCQVCFTSMLSNACMHVYVYTHTQMGGRR